MKVSFCFKVTGVFSARALWALIQKDGVNVLDAEETVWIYGRTTLATLTKVIETCAVFGEISGDIHTGR